MNIVNRLTSPIDPSYDYTWGNLNVREEWFDIYDNFMVTLLDASHQAWIEFIYWWYF